MNVLKVGIGNDSPGGNVAASHIQGWECMKSVTLKLTLEELRMLATLASDQVFRRQFIDPRMPGHKLGKALVARLRLMLDGERVTG